MPLLLRFDTPLSPTMFDIELSLPGSSSHTVILRRDYQEFRALHLALTNLLTSSKVRYEAWADGRFLGLCLCLAGQGRESLEAALMPPP